MREMDLVVLTRDVLDLGLRAGDIGTVVLVHRGGAGYEVEFSTLARPDSRSRDPVRRRCPTGRRS